MFNNKQTFNKIESFILKLCIVSVLVLVGLQGFITNNELAVFLNQPESNLEIDLDDLKSKEKGIILLSIEGKDFEDVEILKNGEVIDKFGKNNEIKLTVYNNDLIEVNGTKYSDSIKVKVVGVSKNVQLPKLNSVVNTSQSIEILGMVILK